MTYTDDERIQLLSGVPEVDILAARRGRVNAVEVASRPEPVPERPAPRYRRHVRFTGGERLDLDAQRAAGREACFRARAAAGLPLPPSRAVYASAGDWLYGAW